jgi:hypothetical protein
MPINRNTRLAELLTAGAEELQEFRNDAPITVELQPLQAWALLANLQLALSHERNKGATARVGRQIAKLLEREFARTPALKEIVRRGWRGEIRDLLSGEAKSLIYCTEFVGERRTVKVLSPMAVIVYAT